MLERDEPVTCKRCRRDAPRQLGGIADDPDWEAWEVIEDAEVICPGCQTRGKPGSIGDDPDWKAWERKA